MDPHHRPPPSDVPLPLPPVETLVHGFGSLSLSSPSVRNPSSVASELYDLGYSLLDDDDSSYFDLESEDFYGQESSLESDFLASLGVGLDRTLWYPRFHDYGSYPQMSGTGIAPGVGVIPGSRNYSALPSFPDSRNYPAFPSFPGSSISPSLPSYLGSSISPTLPSYLGSSNYPAQPSFLDSSISPSLPSYLGSSISPALPSYLDSSNYPAQPSFLDSSISPALPSYPRSSISPALPSCPGLRTDPALPSYPSLSGVAWSSDLIDRVSARQVTWRHGASKIGDFGGFPRDSLRMNLDAGRITGIDESSLCSLIARSHYSIRGLQGNLRSIAKSRTWNNFLLEKMRDMRAEDIEMVFRELSGDLVELMVDPFASHVILELVDVCSDLQRVQILSSVTGSPRLIRICQDQYGALVIKKLLEILTPHWQKQEFARAIRPGVVQLAKNAVGHHLILHILKVFPSDCYQVLLDRLKDKLFDIATNQYGCHVAIRHIQNVQGNRGDSIVAETLLQALTLSQHCYGNYVVQALLGAEMPVQLLHDLQEQFMGSYSVLSRDKYASNVVERCLSKAEPTDVMRILHELLEDFLLLLTDEYANYVAQKMIARSRGLCLPIYLVLVGKIRSGRSLIDNSIFGRKALDRLKKTNSIHL